jgi:uncharacterized protein
MLAGRLRFCTLPLPNCVTLTGMFMSKVATEAAVATVANEDQMRFRFWLPWAALLLWAQVALAGPINEVTVVTAQGWHVFKVELAVTPAARSRGLMHRPELAADAGMLFIFPRREQLSFWMKNTLIPLDMIFLTGDGRIVHVHHMAQPHSLTPIGPQAPAVAVLEINGGLSRRLGIASGDRILHPSLTGKR